MGCQASGNGTIFNEALKLRIPALEDLPRIELRQLRYFLAVAEELNFTRAAERMGIAQPPLSQQILSLESQLRAKLFTRSRRQVKLTKEGEALQVYARRIINTTMLAAESVRAIANGLTGHLAVGAVCSAIHSLIPELLPKFHELHPGVKLHLQEMTVLEQQRALREERIDIAILREPMAASEFSTRKLFEEPFVAAVPRSSPLARLNRISLEQLAREPLVQVYRSSNEEYSDLMFEGLRATGRKLNIAHEASDMQALLGLVGAGFGHSLVPASLQNIQISTVKYIPLSESVKGSTLTLAWNSESVTPVMEHFIAVTEALMESFTPVDIFGRVPQPALGNALLKKAG
ncbi:MAG: LysR family transcriptional regulator [Ahrensia sp.]|nr:LysR family transcriptional regulator [Ahrensia sp.]|tara:strand:+ start:19012 stop:20052 length:1041 start_codon:yes stop_codon:yes gene_type:complete